MSLAARHQTLGVLLSLFHGPEEPIPMVPAGVEGGRGKKTRV